MLLTVERMLAFTVYLTSAQLQASSALLAHNFPWRSALTSGQLQLASVLLFSFVQIVRYHSGPFEVIYLTLQS